LIPYTGFEFGIAHTPWIDYEQSSGWWYRSIDKSFMHSKDGMNLWSSADLGINFKTTTPYITSEIGMFNGESYDHINTNSKNSSGFHNSFEGRVTYHVFGNGNKKVNPTKDQYANISLHLASNIGYNDATFNNKYSHANLNLYHIHAVYNHPMFLIAAQYGKTDYNSLSSQAGDGYSVNAEVRPVQDWALFARYDYWKFKDGYQKLAQGNKEAYKDKKVYYAGIAYTMNKYVKWIANVAVVDYKASSYYKAGATTPNYNNTLIPSADYYNNKNDKTLYMLTAELSW
jgi:hypothetical protein